MLLKKKGNGYVVGSEDEYKKLPRHQKHLMPIYIRTKTITVLLRNVDFFVPNTNIIRSCFPKSVLARCRVKQLVHNLIDDDKKQLNALYPNFSFNSFTLLTRPLVECRGDSFTNKDMILVEDTKYNQLPNIRKGFTQFFTQVLLVSYYKQRI